METSLPMVRDGLRPPHHEVTPHPAALAVSSDDAVATERPPHPGTRKSVPQHGSSAAIPLNPHSRLGREPSPMRQGRVKMETAAEPVFIGIDVSKQKLRGSALGR